MNLIKKNSFSIPLALFCAISIFPMSNLFQLMAYWGNGLMWFWIGVGLTYIIFLIGSSLLIVIFTNKRNRKNLAIDCFGFVTGMLLILGFLWSTFIIIAGMSGF